MSAQTLAAKNEAAFENARRVNQALTARDGEARFAVDGRARAEVGEFGPADRAGLERADWSGHLLRVVAIRPADPARWRLCAWR